MRTSENAHPHFLAKTAAEQLPNETRLISLIRKWLGDVSPPAPRGIGDDCAVLPPPPIAGFRLSTTDCVIRGRHFDDAVAPRHVGRKLVNRNLSDIAAMGGTPSDALLAIVCGRNLALPWLEDFFHGVAAACRFAHLELSGGDCAEGPPDFFCATLALTGFAARPLLRTGAQAGDTLLVSGNLGGSLPSGRHHSFTPRLAEGRWLANQTYVHAAMDISDGLAKDLISLTPKGCDALLFPEKIPLAPELSAAANAPDFPQNSHSLNAPSALVHALCDGEDYELLFAAETARLSQLLLNWRENFPNTPLTPIGKLVPTPNTALNDRRILLAQPSPLPPIPFQPSGYQHFSGSPPASPVI